MTDEKKENGITPETQETLDSLYSPIVKDVEDAGMTRGDFCKALVRLTKAKKVKDQKLKHSSHELIKDKVCLIEPELKRGVKIKAQTSDEVLVEIKQEDHDTQISALNLLGKATGWVDVDAMKMSIPDPLTLVFNPPAQSVKVQPDDFREKKT